MTVCEVLTRRMINVSYIPPYRNTTESQQRVRMMEELDVCSPKFSFPRAEREVKQQMGRMLCDVLLDQRVLPGVGNIIKNEALFDSGLHPTVQVGHTYFLNDVCIFKYFWGTHMEDLNLYCGNILPRQVSGLCSCQSLWGQPCPHCLKLLCLPTPGSHSQSSIACFAFYFPHTIDHFQTLSVLYVLYLLFKKLSPLQECSLLGGRCVSTYPSR